MKLVFVCTGNTCRSNVAELLAVQAAEQAGLAAWEFLSAGLMAYPGAPASLNSYLAVQEIGLDLGSHRARLLDEELVEQADLILTMTSAHQAHILSLYPSAEPKVFTLMEYAYGEPGFVVDPYGGDLPTYRKTTQQIKAAVEKVIEKLRTEDV